MKWQVIILLGVLIIMTSLINASWFDNSYNNKRQINFTNVYEPLNNFTYVLANASLNTTDFISRGAMQSDCDDLIITNSSENQQLNYLFESRNDVQFGCNSNSTIIWVKAPMINTTNGTVDSNYIYFNNSITSQERRNLVFDEFGFFYLFGENNTNVITYVSGNGLNATIIGGFNYTKRYIGYGPHLNTSNGLSIPYSSDLILSGTWSIGWQIFKYNNNPSILYDRWDDTDGSATRSIRIQVGGATNEQLRITYANSSACTDSTTINLGGTNGLPQRMQLNAVFVYNTTHVIGYVNGTELGSVWIPNLCNTQKASGFNMNSWNNATGENPSAAIDIDNLFFIRRQLNAAEIRAISEQGRLNFSQISVEQTISPLQSNITINQLKGTKTSRTVNFEANFTSSTSFTNCFYNVTDTNNNVEVSPVSVTCNNNALVNNSFAVSSDGDYRFWAYGTSAVFESSSSSFSVSTVSAGTPGSGGGGGGPSISLLPIGSDCVQNTQCISGLCDNVTSMCVTSLCGNNQCDINEDFNSCSRDCNIGTRLTSGILKNPIFTFFFVILIISVLILASRKEKK